jgi:iron complex transport system ATP-binding protein
MNGNPGHEAPALVEALGLTLAAAGRTLLSGLDWQARRGERWCVIGRNAAGKSTLCAPLPLPC